MSNIALQEKALADLREKLNIGESGIRIGNGVAENSGAGTAAMEGMGHPGSKKNGNALVLPRRFRIPAGLDVGVRPNADSPYSLEYENGGFYVARNGEPLWERVEFESRPRFIDGVTSDGRAFKEIGNILTDKCLAIWFSHECAFKERNETCLFCDINTGEGDKFLKTAKQIAELAKAAFAEGAANRVDFTGGVIAERREIEYYSDAIEAIKDAVGSDEVTSSACVSAPRDFDNIVRLKEAGFTHITLNLEIWDKNIFNTICPGKARSTGYERWLEAEKFAVDTFGFGHVRCNFVTGIEPKFKTLEGIEYLAGIGVYANPNRFAPHPGTPFEGTRSTTVEWFYDLNVKAAEIQLRYGLTYDLIHKCHPETTMAIFDVHRIKEELLPIFQTDISKTDNN